MSRLPVHCYLFALLLIIFSLSACNTGSIDGEEVDHDSGSDGETDDDDSAYDDDSGDDDDDDISDDDDDDDDVSDDDDDDDDDDNDDEYQPPDGFQVVFFDVGQGDSALLRFPEGSTMLIDGGPNEAGDDVILPHFKKLHLDYVDYMVVTHPDADHCGGLDDVVDSVIVGELWENGQTKDTYTWNDFSDTVDDAGIYRRLVTRGWDTVIDGCDVDIINADEGWTDYNSNSIVLTVQCGGVTTMMTGDATEETQEELIDLYGSQLQSEIVKVPHHGSPNRDSDFPDYVFPEYAVVSCGADNPYGHPNASVVAEWEATGATLYRTDEEGTVLITANGGSMEVQFDD